MKQNWQVAVTPTDTVWGLVAKLTAANLERIYELKGRDKSKPLIIFAPSIAQLQTISTGWNPYIQSIAEKYWPGALTIVMPRSKNLPEWVNPELSTIGMRIPRSKAVSELLADNGLLLSTSANLSGQEPVSNYQEAIDVFGDKVDLIIDDDETCSNQASTIIEYKDSKLKVLRQGDIVLKQPA